MDDTKIALFKSRKIKKALYKNEWWFVVEDVVLALTDTVNPNDYINKMRRRDAALAKGYRQIVHTLSMCYLNVTVCCFYCLSLIVIKKQKVINMYRQECFFFVTALFSKNLRNH